MPHTCSELCGSQVLVIPRPWQGWAPELLRSSPCSGRRKKSSDSLSASTLTSSSTWNPPQSPAKMNYWHLWKSGVTCRLLHIKFFLLESSFLPRASAAQAPRLIQIPAPVGSNPQTTKSQRRPFGLSQLSCALSPSPLLETLKSFSRPTGWSPNSARGRFRSPGHTQQRYDLESRLWRPYWLG